MLRLRLSVAPRSSILAQHDTIRIDDIEPESRYFTFFPAYP